MQDECKRIQQKRRGIRRHHKKRIVQKFANILKNRYWIQHHDGAQAKKVASAGSIRCGCWQCANPRRGRGYGEPRLTVQERRAFQYDWEEEHYDASLFWDNDEW